MTWAAGQQLQKGRYTIREVLGMGRFGVTYLAETADNQRIVIKTPNDEAMLHPEAERLQQVFVQEAFKLARCHHPHIVQAQEPFQENGLWCIPMEYIAGTTLDKRDRPILSEEEALRYIRQVGEALAVVHQNQLLHRDVRPENIMLRIRDGQSEAVLIDFGLARAVDHPMTQTRTNEIAAGFAPLELYSRKLECGAYTDIYSLGATLYTLLMGQVPPSAEKRKLDGVKLDFATHISNSTKRAIVWAMELEAKDRPQAVQDWLKALPLNGEETKQLPKEKPDSEVSPQKWAAWQVIIAAIAAIGALLGGLAGVADLIEAMKPIPTPSIPSAETQTP